MKALTKGVLNQLPVVFLGVNCDGKMVFNKVTNQQDGLGLFIGFLFFESRFGENFLERGNAGFGAWHAVEVCAVDVQVDVIDDEYVCGFAQS